MSGRELISSDGGAAPAADGPTSPRAISKRKKVRTLQLRV